MGTDFRTLFHDRKNRDNLYCKSAYWDKKAQEYEGSSVSMWPNPHLNKLYHVEQLGFIDRCFPKLKDAHILDAGCGTGRMSRLFAERGGRVTGIDFSSRTIDIARKLSTDDANPEYLVGSLFELEHIEAFDIAVTWGVLTVACRNGGDLDNVLGKLRQSLHAGGKLVILEPIHKGLLHRVLNMQIETFCSHLEKAGFKIERIENLHFWPIRLLLAYVPWPNFVTKPLYSIGQRFMSIFPNTGDYKAIIATNC